MGFPKYELPAPDPRYDQLMEQTKQQDILAIQDGLKIDTASIMARYGSLLTMAQGNSGAPAAPANGTLSINSPAISQILQVGGGVGTRMAAQRGLVP